MSDALPPSRPPLPSRLSFAILVFAAVALLIKQTVPIVFVGVPVAPRLLVVASGLVLVQLAPAAVTPGRSMVLRILAVDAFISLMTEADVVAFRINRRFLSVLSVPLVPYLSHLQGAIASAIHPGDALFLIDLAVLIALGALLPRKVAPSRARPGWFLGALGLATIALGAGTDPYWRVATLRNPATAGHASLLPFHLLSTGNAVWTALRAKYFAREELGGLQRWYVQRRAPERAGGPLITLGAGAHYDNLLTVQVESLQAWTVGMRLGDQEITPTLNALRARGVSFENAYSQVGIGNTADAEWLALCSLYPASAGVAFIRYSSEDLNCLPELLRNQGFDTLAFHGNDLSVYNRDEMYVTAGFRRRYGRKELHPESGWYEIPDRRLYEQIPPLLIPDRPFALHAVSFSSHRPFHVPPQGLPLGELQGTITGDYLESIHYADAALGEFLRDLESRHLMDRTLLVVYGDHGGIVREAKGIPDLPMALPANEAGWLAFERRVPLLFVGAGLPVLQITTPAGQIDIAPTIAGLMGLQTRHAGFLGRDLLRTDPRPVVFWAGHVVDDDRVYLEGRAGGPLCLTPGGVPRTDCGSLAEFGRKERAETQLVLDADLVNSIDP